ncbi:hypothetical protein [Cedecea sp.]|uniref:hypothetical protein n=1 Tax=Cedecea sp. TaxID=1970739 RepID=UPI0012AD8206|nr:hypothetical protein [Enterobacteriaceae bacterium RIT693]
MVDTDHPPWVAMRVSFFRRGKFFITLLVDIFNTYTIAGVKFTFGIKTCFKIMGTPRWQQRRKNENHHNCDLHKCILSIILMGLD